MSPFRIPLLKENIIKFVSLLLVTIDFVKYCHPNFTAFINNEYKFIQLKLGAQKKRKELHTKSQSPPPRKFLPPLRSQLTHPALTWYLPLSWPLHYFLLPYSSQPLAMCFHSSLVAFCLMPLPTMSYKVRHHVPSVHGCIQHSGWLIASPQ